MNTTIDNKQIVTNAHRGNHPSNSQAFIAWCKEFQVSILANKDATVRVVVGDHVKYVKLDRP